MKLISLSPVMHQKDKQPETLFLLCSDTQRRAEEEAVRHVRRSRL